MKQKLLILVLTFFTLYACQKEPLAPRVEENKLDLTKINKVDIGYNLSWEAIQTTKSVANEVTRHQTSEAPIEIKTISAQKYYWYNNEWNLHETVTINYGGEMIIPNVLTLSGRFVFKGYDENGVLIYHGIQEKDFSNPDATKDIRSYLIQQKAEGNAKISQLVSTKYSYEFIFQDTLSQVDYPKSDLQLAVSTASTPVYFYAEESRPIEIKLELKEGVAKLNGQEVNLNDWINLFRTYGEGSTTKAKMTINIFENEVKKCVMTARLRLFEIGWNHNLNFKNVVATDGTFDLINNNDLLTDITIQTFEESLTEGLLAFWNMKKHAPDGSTYPQENFTNQANPGTYTLIPIDNIPSSENDINSKHGCVKAEVPNVLSRPFVVGVTIEPKKLGSVEHNIFFAAHADGNSEYNIRLCILGNTMYLTRKLSSQPVDRIDVCTVQKDVKFTVILQVENDYCSVFINGELRVKLPYSDNLNWAGETKLYFGADIWNSWSLFDGWIEHSSDTFDGRISCAFLYNNKTITQAQSAILYNNGNPLTYEQLIQK